jgi:glutamate racemase
MIAPSLAERSSVLRRTVERPVAFIDSGVGGLPYCSSFRALLPAIPVVYVADRAHFPYGPKSRQELVVILVDLVTDLIARMDPRLIVIACNTASVSALDDLRSAFPDLPFVGTVPAVKPAALASVKRRIGVLATERTVRDPYAAHLAERFAPDCELVGIAAPELVEFVEHRYAHSDRAERLAVVEGYIRRFRELGVDSIVLGCTHFLFLADEFVEVGGEDISIFDSREGVARRVASLLEASTPDGRREQANARNLSTPSVAPGKVFVTGSAPIEASWNDFAKLFGLGFGGALGGVS